MVLSFVRYVSIIYVIRAVEALGSVADSDEHVLPGVHKNIVSIAGSQIDIQSSSQ